MLFRSIDSLSIDIISRTPCFPKLFKCFRCQVHHSLCRYYNLCFYVCQELFKFLKLKNPDFWSGFFEDITKKCNYVFKEPFLSRYSGAILLFIQNSHHTADDLPPCIVVSCNVCNLVCIIS